jgi:hypothetical protein
MVDGQHSQQSAGKLLLTAFWNVHFILHEIVDHEAAMNTYCHCTALQAVKEEI